MDRWKALSESFSLNCVQHRIGIRTTSSQKNETAADCFSKWARCLELAALPARIFLLIFFFNYNKSDKITVTCCALLMKQKKNRETYTMKNIYSIITFSCSNCFPCMLCTSDFLCIQVLSHHAGSIHYT